MWNCGSLHLFEVFNSSKRVSKRTNESNSLANLEKLNGILSGDLNEKIKANRKKLEKIHIAQSGWQIDFLSLCWCSIAKFDYKSVSHFHIRLFIRSFLSHKHTILYGIWPINKWKYGFVLYCSLAVCTERESSEILFFSRSSVGTSLWLPFSPLERHTLCCRCCYAQQTCRYIVCVYGFSAVTLR